MNRFFPIFLMAFLAFSSLQAAEVTFNFSSAEGITTMGYVVPEQSAGTNLAQAGPVTVGGVTLSATDGATPTRIWNSQGSFSLRIYVDGTVTLSVAEGSIIGVTVNAANTSNFDLLADVGEYSVNDAVGTWTGSASSVTFTHYGTKNAQVASIVVTTSGEGPDDPDPEDPIDPNITKLDSLHHLAALEDGTPFQFTSDVYVNYQWNDHLWVMQLDEEGEALAGVIYGDTGKQYPLGAVIPAGWTGVKNTYKGLVEVAEPAHFGNPKTILDEDYYSPFDVTGYMSYIADPDEGWQNYKVRMDGIRLGRIDAHGTFVMMSDEIDEDGTSFEVYMTGFNKFGIEYPEVDPSELYSVEGMVTIYDGTMELYPITISNDPGTRLWKVVYEGQEGAWYKLMDTLYIAAAVDAGAKKLLYVTDNVDEIYYDTYIDWGYAEWMAWYPDWIALDCSGDSVLFNALAEAEVLMPGTVKGKLVDRLTNPRLVLKSTPAVLEDVELPTLTMFRYDLSTDYITALGNEVGQVVGYFRYVDGKPCLCSDGDTVVVKLNFDYAPVLESQMSDKEGYNYGLLCVFTLDEPWEENAQAPMHRIHATDEDYYTNYIIYPLAVLSSSAVDEVIVDKEAVDVKYITPAGVMSDTPQEGVNIVVTTHNDGSRTAVKRMVK
ncbi:MAG: hypothetical protein IKX56_03890 [Muribaculaceae bacterium]|nr:hypothetical protein [Muribaculaceae bacterium]